MIRFVFYILFFFALGSLNSYSQTTCSSFSTYFGGNQFDEIRGVCVDNNKNSYIIGNTYSADLPITTGLINDTTSGSYDVFLAKFDSCGTLIWCTYFGSTGFDSGEKISMTKDGNIVFCGYSSSVDLPVTIGCFQPINNGGYDCFITKITPNGSIIWSTYFGGANGDFAYDITTDALDNIVIGGTTTSSNLYTTINSFQPNHKGNTDSFIARFSKNGSLKWCTYYGGNGNEDIHALTIDKNFNIIGIGGSFSTNLNTSAGAYQAFNEGSPDAYILKLDSNCTRIFSSYLGGAGIEDAWGVATDTLNNIFMSGNTNSQDFDTTAGAYHTSLNGTLNDMYLSKWSATGALLKSTLFGGSSNDLSARLLYLPPNNILVIGKTESTDIPILGVNNQTTLSGNYDTFLSLFSCSSLQPTWSSYYGGSAEEDVLDASRVSPNSIVFTGNTNSGDYPLSSFPFQSSLNNSNDGTITKMNLSFATSTNINEIRNHLSSTIYPNPFLNYLSISESTISSVEIMNVLGEIIYHSKNTNYINTENYKTGIYFITITNKNSSSTYKLIKQ